MAQGYRHNESFASLRRTPNPEIQIVPSMTMPGRTAPYELAMLPRAHLDNGGNQILTTDGQPPRRPYPLLASDRKISIDWITKLFENHYIGIHRFFFALARIPALMAIVISTWILWGKHEMRRDGQDMPEWKERGMAISAFVTGIWIGVGWLYGLQNHYNYYKNAQNQTTIRLIHLVATIIFTLVVLVFASITLAELRDSEDPLIPVGFIRYTLNERIVHAAIILGMSIMIFVVTVLAFIYGTLALSQIQKDLYRARRGEELAYRNGAFLYADR